MASAELPSTPALPALPTAPLEIPAATVPVTVNGMRHSATVEPRRTLADWLRDDLGLTATHLGCEHGVCGACTVLVDGDPVRSCLMLAVQARDTAVTTVEGLGSVAAMHPVQQGCLEAMSFQCGFCTPGFLMAITAYLARREQIAGTQSAGAPSDDELREALSGNLCRCTGYQSIVDGVRRAWEITSESSGA